MTQEIKIKERKVAGFNHVWWIPLIALLMAVYLLISHYTAKGPLITLSFKSADGLSVEQTKLKYKDVDIGRIEKIEFSDNLKDVIISARINKASESLLKKGSQFWIVKPRVELTKISGLNTLLSGSYITLDPTNSEQYQYEFVGLESPPIIAQSKPGLKLTLLAEKAQSISPGTTIYYKGLPVGTVERKYFSTDYLWVKVDIFIDAPHDKLISPETRFWSTSGVTVNPSANGLEIEMESLEALITGGIAFETPPSLSNSSTIINGTEFLLFNNKKLSQEQIQGVKHYFVTYFNGSISGLEVGSAVMVQGISVGKVKKIQLLYDDKNAQTRIPVIFEVYENRLGIINQINDGPDPTNIAKKLIKKGLRAKLETANLLAGTKFISLSMTDLPIPLNFTEPQNDPITGYILLPSAEGGITAITTGVTELLAKVNKLPIDDIANQLNQLLGSADKLIGNTDNLVASIEIQKTINNLNGLLKEGETLSQQAKKTLRELDSSLKGLSDNANEALSGFSPDAPLYHNLNKMLDELSDTLESFKSVSDMLDRTPDALIFGEDRKRNDKK